MVVKKVGSGSQPSVMVMYMDHDGMVKEQTIVLIKPPPDPEPESVY